MFTAALSVVQKMLYLQISIPHLYITPTHHRGQFVKILQRNCNEGPTGGWEFHYEFESFWIWYKCMAVTDAAAAEMTLTDRSRSSETMQCTSEQTKFLLLFNSRRPSVSFGCRTCLELSAVLAASSPVTDDVQAPLESRTVRVLLHLGLTVLLHYQHVCF